MKKEYKNLISNSVVFTIANLGSKVISFVMVPLYTYVLSTKEYGVVDLLTTISSLTIPLVFMCMSDAVLRYSMDKRYDCRQVITSALSIFSVGGIVSIIVMGIIKGIYPQTSEYIVVFYLLFITTALMQILNQFLRATEHIKAYAVNGVIYTLAFASLNVLFLVVLHRGIKGYLYSMVITNVICIVIACIISRIWKYINRTPTLQIMGILLRYSLPLVPNALMWWIMDASDKFVITYFLGVGANGLYAVAKKLPTLIDTVHSIFNQAWLMSAIQENENPNSTEFTTQTYKIYSFFLMGAVLVIMIIARPFVVYILNKEYIKTWLYIPWLLISVAFSSMSGFLSSKLIANEQTALILKTTVVGAAVNLVMNFILIPIVGINGAGIATMISFGIVLIIREKLLIKEKKLYISFSRFKIAIIMCGQLVVYYAFPIWMAEGAMILFLCMYMFFMRDIVRRLLQLIIFKGEKNEKK